MGKMEQQAKYQSIDIPCEAIQRRDHWAWEWHTGLYASSHFQGPFPFQYHTKDILWDR